MALYCCKAMGKTCNDTCSCIASFNICDPDFPFSLAITGTIATFQVIASLVVIVNDSNCDLLVWVLIQSLLAIVVTAFVLFVHKKQNQVQNGELSHMKNLCNFYLYDPKACIFIGVLIGGFIWHIVGWIVFIDKSQCLTNQIELVEFIQISSILWLPAVVAVYILVRCCSCCGAVNSGHNGSVRQARVLTSDNAKQQTLQEPQAVSMPSYAPEANSSGPTAYSFPEKY